MAEIDMSFIFDTFIILFLTLPLLLLFWLIRPSYFPFQKKSDLSLSRLKIVGYTFLTFTILLILLALLVPESAMNNANTSAMGIIIGLLITALLIFLSIKKGRTFSSTLDQKSFKQNKLISDIKSDADKPIIAKNDNNLKDVHLTDKDLEDSNKKRSFSEQRKVKSEIYKRLTDIGSDGKITKEEEQEVRNLLLDANLTDKQEMKGFVKAYKKAYEHVVSDNIVTKEEQDSLHRIQVLFSIPSDMIAKELSNLERHGVLRDIQNGNLPICRTNIILKKDEVAHFSYSGDLIEERTVKGRYQGGSAGVSFRVAKGVSFRVGQSRGSFKSEKKPVAVSSGKLIVTNKRIIFDGDKKNFNINLSQLLGYEVFDDSILVKPNRGNPKLVILKDKNYDPDILDISIGSIIQS